MRKLKTNSKLYSFSINKNCGFIRNQLKLSKRYWYHSMHLLYSAASFYFFKTRIPRFFFYSDYKMFIFLAPSYKFYDSEIYSDKSATLNVCNEKYGQILAAQKNIFHLLRNISSAFVLCIPVYFQCDFHWKLFRMGTVSDIFLISLESSKIFLFCYLN